MSDLPMIWRLVRNVKGPLEETSFCVGGSWVSYGELPKEIRAEYEDWKRRGGHLG